MSSFLVKFPLDIHSKRFIACVIICLHNKWLPQHQTLILEKAQENPIESSLQNSLPYILLQMVCAMYCASYPKWLYVKHEANIWYLYYITSFCSKIFYFLLSSSVINVVTTPSDVTDVTVWLITSNPNPRVLKIEKWKINWTENKNEKENKKKLSLLSVILTLMTSCDCDHMSLNYSKIKIKIDKKKRKSK